MKMGIRLFAIIFCAFASFASGASLVNLTSLHHRAENASTSTASTKSLDPTNPDPTKPDPTKPDSTAENPDTSIMDKSAKFEFDPLQYGRKIYKRIYEHLNQCDKSYQFAFLSVARTYELAMDWPDVVNQKLTGMDTLPSLIGQKIFPANARSNLVIVGPPGIASTAEGDTTLQPEQRIVPKLPTMDDYYDTAYFKDLKELFCPFAILLGSTYDSCSNNDDEQGGCADMLIKTKQEYVEATTCTSTLYLVYVNEVRQLKQWEKTQGAYYAAGIVASSDAVDVKPESSEETKKPAEKPSSTEDEEKPSTEDEEKPSTKVK